MAYLDDLCRTVGQTEARVRNRKAEAQANFEAAIKAVVLDLYRAHLSDPSLHVGIGLHQNTLQDLSKSQYGSTIYAPTSFKQAVKALLSGGCIEQKGNFFYDRSGKNSRTRRYQAAPSLLCGFRDAGGSTAALIRHRGADGIRLKDADKNLVEYGDVPFAKAAGDRLRVINDMLQSHWADLALTDEQLAAELRSIGATRDDEAVQSFDFAARTVYRVFNNSDWEQGGRFYGAWWTSCPSRLRRYILLNGKRTVEVDYSGLHAAMLYAMDGQAIPDDPYERCLTRADDPAERKLVKQTFNALLNADSLNRIGEIEGYSPEITGRSWDDFKWHIVSKYPEFMQHFGSGVGLRLQRKDSDLAETVMLKFAGAGDACLPVHDSFIVHHGLQDKLDQIMRETFEAEFGFGGNVGVDTGIGEVVESSDEPIEANLDRLLQPTGYEARLQAFWDHQDKAEVTYMSPSSMKD
ncbi:hypothetical protein [Roseovarius pacificus]|uniref:hypothetical protein n=1 Tax=Roseovarius pacificus TaxID=337701 RepID=UPI0040396C62